ncbi:MAG: hypothetical protein Q3993_00235 [Filifactor alocis]|nr:hypothetical protein [Filifactor alocis]
MERKKVGLNVLRTCFIVLWILSIFFKQWDRSFFKLALSVTGSAYFVWSSVCTRGWKKTVYLLLALVLIALLTAVVLYRIGFISGGEVSLLYLIGIIVLDALIYLKVVHILDREEEE